MLFSDIPHFLLSEFIIKSFSLSIEIAEGATVELINPDFIFKNTTNLFEWKNTTNFTWGNTGAAETWFKNSYIIGPRTTIITSEEGIYLELYRKTELETYVPVRIKTKLEGIEKNRFDFSYIPDLNVPSDLLYSIDEEHYLRNGDPYYSYVFEVYDLLSREFSLDNGIGLYFRKDSIFHSWIKNHATSYLADKFDIDFVLRNYINIDKDYIYLGDVYHDSTKGGPNYYFIHYNMKNYIKNCVPEHQRSDKLEDFFYIIFDMVYNKVYQTQKNIWSMIDPIECDEYLLTELGKYHGIDLEVLNFNESVKRGFIKDFPSLLKSKGTYTVFQKIWSYISNSKNRLNVYEKWHSNSITGPVSGSDYTTYLHSSYYDRADYDSGAGSAWYNQFDDTNYPKLGDYPSDMILSTNHDIEIDISTEPVEEEKVISKETTDALYYLFEKFRPINNIQNYKMLVAPISDISGEYISLYDRRLIAYLDTKSILTLSKYDETIPGVHIEYFSQLSKTIQHNLQTENILIDLYDSQLNKIESQYIVKIETNGPNRVNIELNFTIGTFVIIRRAQRTRLKDSEFSGSLHPWNSIGIITQFFENSNVIYPKDVQLVGNNTILHWEPEVTRTISYPTDFDSSDEDALVWNIQHNLQSNAIIVDVIDTNQFKIYPKRITIVDKNNIELEFNEVTQGEVRIVRVGSIDTGPVGTGTFISNNTTINFTINHNMNSDYIFVQIYDENLNRVVPASIEITDLNNIEITLAETIETYTFIKAVTDSDPYIDLLEGYTWSITTLEYDFNFQNHVTNWFNGNEYKIPDYLKVVDVDRIHINDEDIDKVTFRTADYTETISAASAVWEINHDLESLGLIINVFNDDWELVQPDSISIDTVNRCIIEFSAAQTGHVLIAKVGNPSFEWLLNRLQICDLLLSNTNGIMNNNIFYNPENGMPPNPKKYDSYIATETANGWEKYHVYEYDGSDWIEKVDNDDWIEEININSFEDDTGYVYLGYKLPENLEFEIFEMALKDDDGVLYYTRCSEMYKAIDFEMNVFYKISKSRL